jgi:GntR family transcriptional regulator/MocR family aminotransferase
VWEGYEVDLKKWSPKVDPVYKSKEQCKKLQEEHIEQLGSQQRLHYASSLRLAYLVLPKQLMKPFVAARTLIDGQTPIIAQAVLREFIKEGHFTAHIRRMRQPYHARRDSFTAAATKHLSSYMEASAPAGGLSIACYLKNGIAEDRTVEIAKSIGVELPTLRRLYPAISWRPRTPGWLLGFAALAPDVAARAIEKLSQALAKQL